MKANSFIKHLFFGLFLGCFVLTNTSTAQDSEALNQEATSFVNEIDLVQFAELIQQSDNGDEDSSSADENQDEADEKDKDDRFLGMEFLDYEATLKLLFRLVFNFGFVFILVRLIYYPSAKRKDFLFTYMLISLSIFLLCFMLENVKLDLAFALGLFAIFGIIRYRTDPIPIKEMTYLFIVIAISVMNALVNKKISYLELVVANLAIIGITYGLEKVWLLRHESFKIVLYENIELIKSGQREALEKDLEERTGIKINRVEIGRIDFLRDTALLRIYFYEDDQLSHYEESGGGGGD
ncbi:MAG: DUF4956 domain-containing protein [Flavobacteriales bacterium]|nr:DUF4956 domain-containing protein [Flavobacteriales bacterium]MDG1765378.1 DUF4956 domain-containing protein [Flavobacteriales bacterium]